jgi:hypothetical protein
MKFNILDFLFFLLSCLFAVTIVAAFANLMR